MAVRGSPAKGVGWGDWREGSNPSFSATGNLHFLQIINQFSEHTVMFTRHNGVFFFLSNV